VGMLRLFAGLLVLVVGLAEIATATAQTVVNGRNVTSVQVATGLFTKIGSQRWLERGDDGKTFNFVDDRRDDDRRVDDRRDKWPFRAAPQPQPPPAAGNPQGFANEVSGRNVTSVQVATGLFTMIGPQRWLERRNDGKTFNFVEVRRDKWSVYLLDPSRGVYLQIDLRKKQIFYSDPTSRRRTIYPIVGAAAGHPEPHEQLPGRDRAGPGRDQAAPWRDQAAPWRDQAGPGRDQAGPGRDQAGPGRDQAGPGRDQAGPGRDQAGPGRDQAGPGRDQAGPGRDQAGPGRDQAGPGPDQAGPGPVPGFADEMLNAHNKFRAKHGAQPLTWSADLAASAQTWANQCKLNHDPNRAGFGENIAWGTTTAADTVAMWYSEVAKYDFTKPGFNPDTGHFTQVVWKGSTQLGCGMAMGCPGAFGGGYWVCRYAPPGNMRGAFPENVAPTK
jgi:uncharacterized protein YkwD